MRRKSAFQPSLVDSLETRQLLSHAGVKGHAAAKPAAEHAPAVTPVAAINAAFNSFVQDYSQARAIYLSAIATPSTASPVTSDPNYIAFSNYTSYRVNLLGEQITSALVQAYSTTTSSSHPNQAVWNNYSSLVQSRVDGLSKTATATNQFRLGTLGQALISATPPANSNAPAAALDSLAQDQAIASAKVAVLNGYAYSKTIKSKH